MQWVDTETQSVLRYDAGEWVGHVTDDPGVNGRWRAWAKRGESLVWDSITRDDDREEAKAFVEALLGKTKPRS